MPHAMYDLSMEKLARRRRYLLEERKGKETKREFRHIN